MEQGFEERHNAARARIGHDLDRLAEELPMLNVGRLACAVDDIRKSARAHHFGVVAELASGLERAMAKSASMFVVRPYLDAMRDAVECDSMDPAVAASYLASINVRLML